MVIKSKLTPAERRAFDNLMATSARNEALTDYIAMMCDVELPTFENEETSEENKDV